MARLAGALNLSDPEAIEAAIRVCVRDFYDQARADPLLGPIFSAKVADWDTHLRVIEDFWSSVLLGTTRYSSHPYGLHVPLPIDHAHIDRWLGLFAATAHATLPSTYADAALARAQMMGDSFKVGLFPFRDREGRPSRHPA